MRIILGQDVFSVALHDDNNPSKSFVLPVNAKSINPVNDAPVLSSAYQVQASEGSRSVTIFPG